MATLEPVALLVRQVAPVATAAPVVRKPSTVLASLSTAIAARTLWGWSALFSARLPSRAFASRRRADRNGSATPAFLAQAPREVVSAVPSRRSRQSPILAGASIHRRPSAPARASTAAGRGVAMMQSVRRRRRPVRVPALPQRGSTAGTRGRPSRATAERRTVALLAGAATERRRLTVRPAGPAAASTARPSSPVPSVRSPSATSRADPVPAPTAGAV